MNLKRKKYQLLKLFYYIISFPFLLMAFFILKINSDNFIKDLRKAILYVKENADYDIDDKLIKFLIAAEDHRFYYHIGIDQIAMLRAIYIYFNYSKYQGASTIEQQFIRVITNRYERTKWRKLREQLLALLLGFYIKDKHAIAKSYIFIAFYGSGLDGFNSYLTKKGLNPSILDDRDMLELVSRLKYPEPLIQCNKWRLKIEERIKYIKIRYSRYL